MLLHTRLRKVYCKFQDLLQTQNIFWFLPGHPIVYLVYHFSCVPFRMSVYPRNRLIRDGNSMTYPDTTTCSTAQEFTAAPIPNGHLQIGPMVALCCVNWSKISIENIWMLNQKQWCFPPNHPFVHRVFHYKPSILGGFPTIFGNTYI